MLWVMLLIGREAGGVVGVDIAKKKYKIESRMLGSDKGDGDWAYWG